MAAHFGQAAMVRFLLRSDAAVDSSTNAGYTPLHQAAQQGHTLVINLLLEGKAKPNTTTNVCKIYEKFISKFISFRFLFFNVLFFIEWTNCFGYCTKTWLH